MPQDYENNLDQSTISTLKTQKSRILNAAFFNSFRI